MSQDIKKATVSELTELIQKGNAHVSFEDAVADLAPNLRTEIPGDLPYSIWQLVEHIRITQKDIVDFSSSDNYKELKWPDEYWPEFVSEIDDDSWNASLDEIQKDRQRFFDLLNDESKDLFKKFEWGDGQTLFREAVLIADHNSYHTAEIVVIRRLLKAWK
ncbi:DinB family protein [Dyadobacter psychrotolerans]|uniref:DinB family protein n=1 Tax=Dyadobacter psychrotolerans TaxID=2541721 RepID=A0A4R5DPD6_9BACT|nr:DinB family protein [Dyadobacter psychrotolerans]TDE15427.1 DinB family protein [Dyadobacter psychrotolerans]